MAIFVIYAGIGASECAAGDFVPGRMTVCENQP
jgi:hypothetical protein